MKIWALLYFICILQALISDLTLHLYFIYTGYNCIPESGSFRCACLAKLVLITAIPALNNLRRDPIEKGSGALRFAEYKQYSWWVNNCLRKSVRKVIPACALKEIRKNYPSENGKYIPFMESTEDENRIESVHDMHTFFSDIYSMLKT